MIINELLVDKYRVQKALDQQVGHRLKDYVVEIHKKVQRVSETEGLGFTYGIPGTGIKDNKPNKAIHRT